MRARIGKCRRRRRQVAYRRAQAGSASRPQAPAEARPGRPRCTGRPGCRRNPDDPSGRPHRADRAAHRGTRPGTARATRRVRHHHGPSLHPGEGAPGRGARRHGRARDRAEVPQARHSEVDSRLERVPEVGVHRVEPAQHRRREASLPQRQAFGDAGYPEPRGSVLQRRAGSRGCRRARNRPLSPRPSPRPCPGGEEPGVGGDRSQVNGEHGALRAVVSGYGGGRRGRAHRAT